MEFRYTAIVLEKKDIGESDRMYVLYTRESGKVCAVARGVRKSHARLASSLENFHTTSIVVMRSRGTGNIKSAIIEKRRDSLRTSYAIVEQIFGVVDFMRRVVGWEEVDPQLFSMLDSYLSQMDKESENTHHNKLIFFRDLFLGKALFHLGYGLSLRSCVACSAPQLEKEQYWIEFAQGGIVCELCRARHQSNISGQAIGLGVYKLLRLLPGYDLPSLQKIVVSDREARSFHSVVEQMYEHARL